MTPRADTDVKLYLAPCCAAAPEATAGNIAELQLLPGAAGVMTATQDCRIQIHQPQVRGSGVGEVKGTGVRNARCCVGICQGRREGRVTALQICPD